MSFSKLVKSLCKARADITVEAVRNLASAATSNEASLIEDADTVVTKKTKNNETSSYGNCNPNSEINVILQAHKKSLQSESRNHRSKNFGGKQLIFAFTATLAEASLILDTDTVVNMSTTKTFTGIDRTIEEYGPSIS
ncbi:hypothetical protein CDAR_190291 [Caerostris darwini]|uniref:Uncharacterized protein n=1 Tax=Caerostris darwini TaxID=1538125 RepID=A0AAV4MLX9_9ARAC|nr:hypothetical protein CDAR_190291 [Caerostris darwini]